MIPWRDVVAATYAVYNDRANYAYFYGAKGQVLTDPLMDALIAAEPEYFSKYGPEQMAAIREYSRGKVGLDCSGFVCWVLERAGVITREQWTYSTALIGKCDPKASPLDIPAAGILYRCSPTTGRHVGIDVDHGNFLHMGREGSSVEIGSNLTGFWEVGGCFPGIDYSGWSQGGKKHAQAKETMWVRSGPDRACPAIGTVLIGQVVTVIEELASGWLKIEWPGADQAYTSNVGGMYYMML